MYCHFLNGQDRKQSSFSVLNLAFFVKLAQLAQFDKPSGGCQYMKPLVKHQILK